MALSFTKPRTLLSSDHTIFSPYASSGQRAISSYSTHRQHQGISKNWLYLNVGELKSQICKLQALDGSKINRMSSKGYFSKSCIQVLAWTRSNANVTNVLQQESKIFRMSLIWVYSLLSTNGREPVSLEVLLLWVVVWSKPHLLHLRA